MTDSFLSISEIFPTALWLIIIITIVVFKRNANENVAHYKYYYPNFFAKLFFALLYGVFYIGTYEGGGDTAAYFYGAVNMNNLFFHDPSLYFEVLLNEPDQFMYSQYFTAETGFPPGWIYKETPSFFVSKIFSLISFITFKSYFATTVLMAYLTSRITWKLFEFIRSFQMNQDKYLILGILLMPSVNFWCSGVSKDTVVYIAILMMVYHGFHILSMNHSAKFKNYFFLVFYGFILFHTRSFILYSVIVPLLFAFGATIVKKLGGGNMGVIFFRTVVLVIGLGALGGTIISQNEEQFMKNNATVAEAAIIQDDFQNNSTYGTKRYDLGEVRFTPIGFLLAMPIATFAGIFYPMPWQALSPTLFFNGIESLLFLYFCWLFVKKKLIQKINLIRGHEFLIFCLVFVVLIGFMTGLTSGLYGVLVRLRAPLVPFFFVLLTVDWDKLMKRNEGMIEL